MKALFVALIAGVVVRSRLYRRGQAGKWLETRLARHEERRMRDPLYARLRTEVTRVGAEYEKLPYDSLRSMPDALAHGTTLVDGIEMSFDAELVDVDPNGDLRVCIDAHAPAHSAWWRSWPSYSFVKRPDGRVYY